MSKVYTLLFEGYADWEIGHALAELRRFANLEVTTIGFTIDGITSMGGLFVIPDMAISEIDIEDVRIFILPGGTMWKCDYPNAEIEHLLHRLAAAQIPIAAICGATSAVARAGLLSGRKHTSNSLSDLSEMVPGYSEHADYVEALAIKDEHIITASGLGAIEFTVEIFKELGLATSDTMAIWYEAFKHGKYPQ